MKINLEEISLELSNMLGIFSYLCLINKTSLTQTDKRKVIAYYSKLNREARELIKPLVQEFVN